MSNALTTFNKTVSYVVSLFNECSEDKTKSTLEKCVDVALVWDDNVLAVIATRGDIDNKLCGSTIREYAFSLLYCYIYSNDLVKLIDD